MKQIDCFNIHMKFWTLTGIWPGGHNPQYYKYYTNVFVSLFIIIYNVLFSINFFFVDKKMDNIIEEMIFYFTDLACASKVFTYLLLREDIENMLSMLESDMFQPVTECGFKIVKQAKNLAVWFWKFYAVFAVSCHIAHVFIPVIVHIFFGIKLDLPVCSYSFLSDSAKDAFVYPLYFYQSAGIHMVMWYNINIDSFIIGVMILTTAQLEVLDDKLKRVTEKDGNDEEEFHNNESSNESKCLMRFNHCIVHFDDIIKFCSLIQKVFGITLFVQFSMASYIICVCLFRFTLPAAWQYYIFLAAYMTCMIIEVMVPCFFGTNIINKSTLLSEAIYNCEWTGRSECFKSNMKFFMARASRPLIICGWKMFPLSLNTFTAIMNSAYSAFALLRNMQTR